MASCCSRRCPIFFVISVTLAMIAISSVVHSISKNSHQESPISFPHHYLSLNASQALRRAGFILMADLFQRSPPFFLPPPNSTFFAIKDSAFTNNTSLPPWLLKNILLFHTFPFMASLHNLLNKPPGSCISTLFRHKNIGITKIHPQERLVEINHVLISDPDIFLDGDHQIAIHGVLAPFSSSSPSCRSNSGGLYGSKSMERWWNRIIQLLSSKGYASFSIGLHSVLEGIRRDSTGFDSVTILAPPDLGLLGSSSPLLDRAVRLHILPQRFTYTELTSLPCRTSLKTLMPDESLEIDGVNPGFNSVLVINGVEIVAPDVSVSERFVIHGISRAFELDELGIS